MLSSSANTTGNVARETPRVDVSELLANISRFATKLEAFQTSTHCNPKPALQMAQEFIQLLSFVPDQVPVVRDTRNGTQPSPPFVRLSSIVTACVFTFAEYANASLTEDKTRGVNVRIFLSALETPELRGTVRSVDVLRRGVTALNGLQQSFKSSSECQNLQARIQRSRFAQAAPLVVTAWFGVPAGFTATPRRTPGEKPKLPQFSGIKVPPPHRRS